MVVAVVVVVVVVVGESFFRRLISCILSGGRGEWERQLLTRHCMPISSTVTG